ARAVGINRAIIYRHFTGKEELFVLTLCSYLDELAEKLATASQAAQGNPKRLDAMVGALVDFGLAPPAYVDCALSVMHSTGRGHIISLVCVLVRKHLSAPPGERVADQREGRGAVPMRRPDHSGQHDVRLGPGRAATGQGGARRSRSCTRRADCQTGVGRTGQ